MSAMKNVQSFGSVNYGSSEAIDLRIYCGGGTLGRSFIIAKFVQRHIRFTSDRLCMPLSTRRVVNPALTPNAISVSRLSPTINTREGVREYVLTMNHLSFKVQPQTNHLMI